MLKIAYFGSDKFSIRCLTHLLPKYADAITVVARTAKLSGRGLRQYREPLIVGYASQTGLPLVRADERADFDRLRGQFDICVAVSFGLLIPASFLESLKYPGLNVHPSLLPAFSGPAPLQRALLSHQNYTGVSLQTLDKKRFDRGRILAQERQDIAETETFDSLCEKLADAGGRLLRNSLDTALQTHRLEQIHHGPHPAAPEHARPALRERPGRLQGAAAHPQARVPAKLATSYRARRVCTARTIFSQGRKIGGGHHRQRGGVRGGKAGGIWGRASSKIHQQSKKTYRTCI
ncbi:hypothetical protein KL941_000681 [Ogataea angusta]|nr:hypothetical protein KL941_000681 [Ogataea angusta]